MKITTFIIQLLVIHGDPLYVEGTSAASGVKPRRGCVCTSRRGALAHPVQKMFTAFKQCEKCSGMKIRIQKTDSRTDSIEIRC